jgi:hypothetical protein
MHFAPWYFFVSEHRFCEGTKHRHARIELRVRVLKNHLKIGTGLPQLPSFQPIHVSAFEDDAAEGWSD